MPMRLPPYKHQAKELDKHWWEEARFLFWQMRTGKTKVTIDTACKNYVKRGNIDGVIVFAPNGVHDNWVLRELPQHHWNDVPHTAVAWSAMKKPKDFEVEFEALLKADGLAWFCLNSEALTGDSRAKKFIARFVKARPNFLLVFDESQDFGTPGAKRTKSARALAKRARMRRNLSGTPAEDSPFKLYSQFELLKPGALGFKSTGEGKRTVSGFTHFKNAYGVYDKGYGSGGRTYPKITGYQNLDDLRERMAPFVSVVLREDCEDMPKLIETRRYYDPTKTQVDLYEKLLDGYLFELEDGTLSTFEGGVRGIKLQQVLGGFFIDENCELNILEGGNPRLDALMEELEVARWRGKVIIWARFRAEIQMIADRLREAKVGFVEYHGGVKRPDRIKNIDAFNRDKRIEVFLGHPKAGGRGLNLGAAKSMLWYSYAHDAEPRRQANERATLMGGEDIDVVDIVANNWASERIQTLVDTHVLENFDVKGERAEYLSRAGMQAYLEEMLASKPGTHKAHWAQV